MVFRASWEGVAFQRFQQKNRTRAAFLHIKQNWWRGVGEKKKDRKNPSHTLMQGVFGANKASMKTTPEAQDENVCCYFVAF